MRARTAPIRAASGSPEPLLTREAVIAIHEFSKGISRTIPVMRDSAFVNGFAAEWEPVGHDLVLEVCRDFQFGNPPASPIPAGDIQLLSKNQAELNPNSSSDDSVERESMFGRFGGRKRVSFF